MSALCPACESARSDPHWPLYLAGCQGCQVRALAGSLALFESERSKTITPAYRSALERIAGDGWRALHEQVKAERARHRALLAPKGEAR